MQSTAILPQSPTIHDLRPGDIIIFNVHGVHHAALYSPVEGEQGDLIQMTYDTERSGAVKSTLSKQLLIGKDVYAFRSKSKWINGEELAAQAEYWLRQGVVFDERRLARSMHDYSGLPEKSEEHNVFQYLKYAARRDTAPIKVHHYPYNYTSYMAGTALAMLFPDYTYCRPLTYFFAKAVDYTTSSYDRPKGMNCIMLVVLSIAAVALKEEIKSVNAETGWVSLRYSTMPDYNDLDFFKTLGQVKEELGIDDYDAPGLETLFTDEQLEQFDIERIKEKLTSAVVKLNPQQPSPENFLQNLREDKENWESLGVLDKTVIKTFDKAAFGREVLAIKAQIEVNRKAFIAQFGPDIFNRNPDRPERHYSDYQAPGKKQ